MLKAMEENILLTVILVSLTRTIKLLIINLSATECKSMEDLHPQVTHSDNTELLCGLIDYFRLVRLLK